MEKKRRKGYIAVMVVALVSAQLAAAPVLKPLDPADGCGQTLETPGHYVLTGDLMCAGPQSGIYINASNVVLHLAGHTISNATCDDIADIVGIFVLGGLTRVEIEGGTISGFNDGVILSSSNSRVSGMTVTGACFFGILGGGDRNKIENNAVRASGYGVALAPATNTLIKGNDFSGNVSGVVISDNGADNNVVEYNVINNNLPDTNGNGGYGVLVANGTGNTIRYNAVNDNAAGITLGFPGNLATFNTVSGSTETGITITVDGAASAVRRNTVLGSAFADLVDESGGCDGNTWYRNLFQTDLVLGVPDGGANAGCIKW
jgi:parallel beta-helix repeat protein